MYVWELTWTRALGVATTRYEGQALPRILFSSLFPALSSSLLLPPPSPRHRGPAEGAFWGS